MLVGEVEDWFMALDPATASLVGDAIDLLERDGPTLSRPLADRIKGSKLHNLKELRPGSTGQARSASSFASTPRGKPYCW